MCTRSVESKCAALLAALAVLGMPNCAGAQGYPVRFDFGGPASAEDIAKVAIAIGPDGEGLPAGKGDYATGKKVYETSCTACHGEDLQGVRRTAEHALRPSSEADRRARDTGDKESSNDRRKLLALRHHAV